MMQSASEYQRVCERIAALGMFGSQPEKDLMRRLLERLSYPEKGLEFIHIAGTNGKGSVAHYTAAILRQFGMKAGLYTSPHIFRMTERIRFDGEEISKEDFSQLAESVLDASEDIHPTSSNVLLAVALLYYSRQDCDVVVMETGLGGRHDSTAAVDESVPATVSVITRIALDHTGILGDDVITIAGEKAGILRKETLAVLAENDDDVLDFLKNKCDAQGIHYNCVNEDENVAMFVKDHFPKLSVTYQRENLMSAIVAAGQWVVSSHSMENDFFENDDFATRLLLTKSFSSAVTRAMDDVRIPERLTILEKDPPIVCDGAHNPCGVKALGDSLKALFPKYRFVGVAGILRDKDYEGMARAAAEWLDGVYLVRLEVKGRTSDHDRIVGAFRDHDVEVLDRKSLDARLSEGYALAAFGSFYLFGELTDGFSDTFGSLESIGLE